MSHTYAANVVRCMFSTKGSLIAPDRRERLWPTSGDRPEVAPLRGSCFGADRRPSADALG